MRPICQYTCVCVRLHSYSLCKSLMVWSRYSPLVKVKANFLSITNIKSEFFLYISQVCASTIICWHIHCILVKQPWHSCLKTIRFWFHTILIGAISVHHLTLVTVDEWSNIGISDHQTLLWPSLFGVFTSVSRYWIWSIRYWTIYPKCYIIWHHIAGTANQLNKLLVARSQI